MFSFGFMKSISALSLETMHRSAVKVIKTVQVANWTPIVRAVHAEAKVAALGLELPAPAVPKGNFVNYVVVGNIAYLSGHLPQVIYIRYQIQTFN